MYSKMVSLLLIRPEMFVLLGLTLFFIIALCPPEKLERIIFGLKQRAIRPGQIERGRSLLDWMDSFGTQGMALNFNQRLPERYIYKDFGNLIHEIWNQVKEKGGELGPRLRILKTMLREDLKRQKRENQILSGAYIQTIIMLILVWTFILMIKYYIGVKLSTQFISAVILWQLFGVIVFRYLIQMMKKSYFTPLNLLLKNLLELYCVYFKGALVNSYLSEIEEKLSGEYLSLERRLRKSLEVWRQKGHADRLTLIEFEEDLTILAKESEELFSNKLKILTFAWSLLFILPILFAAGLFGLAGQDIV